MAKHLNRHEVIGNIGKDPEIRYLPSGDPVASFSVATTKSYKDGAGQEQETTTWHNFVAFNQLATIVEKLIKKGSLVHIESEYRTRKIPANHQYPERTVHEFVASEVRLLRDARPRSEDADLPPPPPQSAPSTPRSRTAPAPAARSTRPARQEAPPPPQTFEGEDIPFHESDPSI